MRHNLDEDSNSSSSLPSKKIKLATKHSTKLNGERSSKLSKRESCIENVTSDDEGMSVSEDSYHSSISSGDVIKKYGKNINTKRKDEYKVTDSDELSCHDKEKPRVGSLNHKYDISDDHLSTEKFSNKSRISRVKYSLMSDSSLSDSSKSISLKNSKNKNEINCTKETSGDELCTNEISQKHLLNVGNDAHNNVNENNISNTSVENVLPIELGIKSEFNVRNNKDQIRGEQNGDSTKKVSEKESGDENNTRTSLLDALESDNEVSIDEVLPSGANTEREKHHIESAIEWLKVTINDISDLGSLVAMQANKFSEKKITEFSLNSYTDVLETFSKLKQLIGGIHTNYQQIEQSLESNLVPWKYMTGLENPNHDKSILNETSQIDMSIENFNNQNNIVQECKDSHQGSNNVSVLPETQLEKEIIDFPGDEGVSVNELAKSHLEENGGNDFKPIMSPQKITSSTETDAIVGTCNKLANQIDTSFQCMESLVDDVSKYSSTENKKKGASEPNLPLDSESLVSRDAILEKITEDAKNKPSEDKKTCDNALDIQENEIVENLQTLISSKQENMEITFLNNVNQSSIIDEDNILKVDSIVPDNTVCPTDRIKSNYDNCDAQVKGSNQDDHSVSVENPEDTHTVNINEGYEALQKMLDASTDSEIITSSLSSTDDSEEIQFDDSDVEIIKVSFII